MTDRRSNPEYDRGWVDGCDAQNECNHEAIIKPLQAENENLKKKYKANAEVLADIDTLNTNLIANIENAMHYLDQALNQSNNNSNDSTDG